MNEIKFKINGKEVSAEEFSKGANREWLKNRTLLPNTYRAHDPLISDSIGCMKHQVPEMREVIRKHNIKGVQVRNSGQLEITSRRGRKELLNVRGLVDADGCFGD